MDGSVSRADVGGEEMLFAAPAMLVVAHPGHELRAFGWLQRARPLVQIVTDGAGRSGQSRAPTSARLVEAAGGTRGAVFGQLSDRQIYDALLGGQVGLFIELLERLTDDAIAADVRLLIGDAAEGYNPTHDLTRALIDCTAETVARRTGRRPYNLAFQLTEWASPARVGAEPIILELAEEVHLAKIAACADFPDLKGEVDHALASVGADYFRREHFWLAPRRAPEPIPAYERTGAERVEAGAYVQTIRAEPHVTPMIEALWRHALA